MPETFSFSFRSVIIKVSVFTALVLILSTYAYTQHLTKKELFYAPKFVIELSGSYNAPIGSSRGEMADFFSFKNYGLIYGIGFDLNIKYAADKNAALFPYVSFGFVHLQNDDNLLSYIDSNSILHGYPLSGNQIYSITGGTSVLVLRNIHVSAGMQYSFSSDKRLSPFAAIELSYNFISGYYEQEPYPIPGGAPAGKTVFDIKMAHRIGAGVSLGLNYRLTNELGFRFGAKYINANIIGKESKKTGDSSTTPGDKNSMYLLDAAAAELNSNLSSGRSVSYLQFEIGFSVFFGKQKTK